MIESTHTREVVKNRGGFGGLYALNPILEYDLTEPILVTSTDGVGTKTEFVHKYLVFGKVHDFLYEFLILQDYNYIRSLFSNIYIDKKQFKQILFFYRQRYRWRFYSK